MNWSGPPASLREYLRRQQLVPWFAAGFVCVLGALALLCLFVIGRDPLSGFAAAKGNDTVVTSSVVGIFMLAAAVAAPLLSRRASILARRGKLTHGQVIGRSMLRKNGVSPTTIAYSVDGRPYRFHRDILVDEADTMQAEGVEVLYDPQRPSRAIHIPPEIARLPVE